jgi:multidrug efflux pump subunit AcrB
MENVYDIRVKIPEAIINSEDEIGSLGVRNIFGNILSLSSAVNMEKIGSMQTITRINRQRTVSVFGSLLPGASQSDILKKAQEIAEKELPDGYSFALEGSRFRIKRSVFDSYVSTFHRHPCCVYDFGDSV